MENSIVSKVKVSGEKLFITFRVIGNVNYNNLFYLNYSEGKYKSFKCHEIKTLKNKHHEFLEVVATEYGYHGSRLLNDTNLDIRNLVGKPVELITDKDRIDGINQNARYC